MRGRTHKPRMFHVYTRYIIYLLKGLKEQQRTSEFINKGTFFIMFIFMTLLGIAKGGVFVRIFLLCLSGVVVYFSKRVYILACKKADVSKIANSAQEIGVITFVFAIVCGFVELMALCCSSL
jgi:hypothetical protein